MKQRQSLSPPTVDWYAPRSRERWIPVWRPFEGPLSSRAQGYALGVLNNLYRFLADQNYLMGDSWHGIHVPRKARPALDVGRSLTEDQWTFELAQLDALPPISAHQRLQVVLPLRHATRLRLSEVVAATTGHLEWVNLPGAGHRAGTKKRIEGRCLEVVGKGNKLRRVPVPPGAIARHGAYLVARGHPADRGANRVPGGVTLLGHTTDLGERAPWAGAHTAANPVGSAAEISAVTLAKQIKRFLMTVPARCISPIRAARIGWRPPARTGCGIHTFRMRWRPACRSR
ncbi:hypothetical protein P3W85_35710 [Cupriavidus basilensis]|uniref:Uncharacterized protein n=1 Tax=Cupriavidus basilensis TaxID=68895 RepID=A0ABT6B2R2_9BURK|nr:hypothetical protein [Cupriavidus basilensis]MDF3838241.1 hypothetical protein [Cupriavidus basilensis]